MPRSIFGVSLEHRASIVDRGNSKDPINPIFDGVVLV